MDHKDHSEMGVNRRFLLKGGAILGSTAFIGSGIVRGDADQSSPQPLGPTPRMPYGIQWGDLTETDVTLWAACDRPSRLQVEISNDEDFLYFFRKLDGPAALEDDDYTVKLLIDKLPPIDRLYYRVYFIDLETGSRSDIIEGSIPLMKKAKGMTRFLWSGDTAGQGWGINPEWGGMRIYETMRRMKPDFFIHSGDCIYADGPLQEEVELDDGSIWKNIVTPEKRKVAETLKEFRGQYQYNLLDTNIQAFNREVPQYFQWDDHETVNNWYPGEILNDDRYRVKSVDLLAARAKKAFLEFTPIAPRFQINERIYRKFQYGDDLEIFMIDLRSFRAANSPNTQLTPSAATDFLGKEQLNWLKSSLAKSESTWKVIASDIPIGLLVRDGDNFENGANGDGPALGRELEIAQLLSFISDQDIKNIIWLTADVHYAAAHYYNPKKAVFKDFKPFWEFVSGPLHAGTFGPNEFDNTFGPELKFLSIPTNLPANRPPSDGYQFFGCVDIDSKSKKMTVKQINVYGEEKYAVTLIPE
ncbi:alkaline phosphatase D family protein [Pseudobacteriovorax antillogorgiicola]|uniref:Alkaline phosphatase D n=1 Tax=Pseudobacteriovorax antillogorgiicola TaxID=1513793 RepID=A0A1Y6BTJ1_9BACT|nr:alkaline phosphatase D family protein [Pseudobacteriovorax antillogorgiicola]TCS54614.1 alkaline phosphatase D [Pseudobacteriovorax antillogorgiicola]SMF17451.1 alkaline phosphatase D [Pseudobacteriovorax antillogorgiicola]